MAQKIIIRTPNHLGDCVMSLPMVSETKEAHPGSQLTILTPEHLVDLYDNNPAVDNVIPIPAKILHGLIAVTKIKELLSHELFDIGYILPPSFGAAAGFKLAGIKERIGYIADGRRLLLTKPLPLPTPLNDQHRSELYFNLLRRGAGVELTYVKPKLFFNDDDITQVHKLLQDFGLEAEQPYVVIAFQAVAESRRWGLDKYTELTKRLINEKNYKVVLVGGEEEIKTGEKIVEAAGVQNVINLAGKTRVRETAAVMSEGKLFIGNDSGPAHLAAAAGCQIIVLSGADDPQSTSPMAVNKVLIYEEDLPCISCVKNKCPLKGDEFMQCMNNISVERVYTAAELLLA